MTQLRKLFASLLMTLVAGFASCGQSQQTGWTSLGYDEFASAMEQEAGQVLDVRTQGEFVRGHIPGALNIDIRSNDFAERCDEKLLKGTPVYVYCRSGHRSKIASDILADKGFRVVELSGGYESWKGKKEYGTY